MGDADDLLLLEKKNMFLQPLSERAEDEEKESKNSAYEVLIRY